MNTVYYLQYSYQCEMYINSDTQCENIAVKFVVYNNNKEPTFFCDIHIL